MQDKLIRKYIGFEKYKMIIKNLKKDSDVLKFYEKESSHSFLEIASIARRALSFYGLYRSSRLNRFQYSKTNFEVNRLEDEN